jgi:uncharacterized damage-inducible protein DinB
MAAVTDTRADLPPAFDERTQLDTMLEFARATTIATCSGLGDADARRVLLPGSPLTTVSGIVSHLRWVEHVWIEHRLLGEPDRAPYRPEDPDLDFRVGLDVPLAQLLADYRDQCDRLRERTAGLPLDTVAVRPIRGDVHVDLRWIMLHLIEETARHNGHLDILREQLDGVTGR